MKVWLNTRLVGSDLFPTVTNTHQQLRCFRRYGIELGRLGKAHVEAKKAYDVARRGKVAASVIQDAQVCISMIAAHLFWLIL